MTLPKIAASGNVARDLLDELDTISKIVIIDFTNLQGLFSVKKGLYYLFCGMQVKFHSCV